MVVCAVFGCDNHDRHRQEKGISFCKTWVNLCKRKDDFNVKNARICSIHFVPGNIGESHRHILLDYHPKNAHKLKDTAVPTQQRI